MAVKSKSQTRVEYESFEVWPEALTLTSDSALERLESLTRLDRPLAWVSTVAPALGLIIAIILLFQGYGGPVEFGVTAVMYIATMTGIVVGFHRHFTHRAFKTKTFIRVTLAILGSMAFQGPVIWWVATHRRHHQISDQPGDPHSPHMHGKSFFQQCQGLFHAHMGWLFKSSSMRALGWSRFAPDLYKDEAILKVHMWYFYWLFLGFAIPAVAGGILTSSWTGVWLGALWGGLVRIFFSSHFFWGLNSICHFFGARPFNNPGEHSKNNFWFALPTLGEGWHNNHHAFPSSALIGLKWWQVDPGGRFIRTLEIFGLAWDVKVPTARMIEAKEKASAV